MRPLARSSPCNGGAEVGDGVLPWPEALSPERCSVARWRHLTITVPGHIIILIIRAPIMLLRRPAITLRAMALRQVGTQSPTACNASGLTIRGAERILGQTAVAIHALERCETVTCKLAMDDLDLTVRWLVSEIEVDHDFEIDQTRAGRSPPRAPHPSKGSAKSNATCCRPAGLNSESSSAFAENKSSILRASNHFGFA